MDEKYLENASKVDLLFIKFLLDSYNQKKIIFFLLINL